MRQSILVTILLLGVAAPPLMAQPSTQPAAAPAPRPAPPPRARGPALDLAVEAAQTAIKACLDNGYKTTALVADSAGVPVAMLSADGASAMTQTIASRKVATVIRYKTSSGAIAERVKTDATLAQEVKDDPRIAGFAWQGGLPLMTGGEQIGAIAVSGAPGGEKDEACAQPAVAAIADRLK